jgi:hypothetical protein
LQGRSVVLRQTGARSVLRHLRIDPPLQGAQSLALQTLPYMLNTLVFMVPRRRFWEEDGLAPAMWTDARCGTVMAQRFGADPDEVTGLVANPRGWAAEYLDRLPREEAMRRVVGEIERLRPAAKGALEAVAMHSWANDRHARGDWAVFAPGQGGRGQEIAHQCRAEYETSRSDHRDLRHCVPPVLNDCRRLRSRTPAAAGRDAHVPDRPSHCSWLWRRATASRR